MKKEDNLEARSIVISNLLREIGISPHLKGFKYLKEALLMDEQLHPKITKDVYPELASKFSASIIGIERAMRNAIAVGFSHGNYELINDIFGYCINPNRGCPSNLEFITTIHEHLFCCSNK